MAKLAFRPDADGFAFVNSFMFDASERAVLTALVATQGPILAGVAAAVIPVVGPFLAPFLVNAAVADNKVDCPRGYFYLQSRATDLFATLGDWSNTINYWHRVLTSGGFDQYNQNQFYFQSSVNFYLDEMKQVAVGVDYTNGDNLTTNQFDVNTWTVSLKAKFGK
jgi:hypothetical protein